MSEHQTEMPNVNRATYKPKPGLETPDILKDKYRLLDKLGEGTQGNVYKALRLEDNKIVAIKKLRIDSINSWKEYDLFRREADVLASINEHGVAEFYDAIENLNPQAPAAYIVQELIEGRSLNTMLKTGFRFTISRIFSMALGLINLLERLHAHNPPIIHRDIKPNNIIMKPTQDAEFEPYLIDFGAVANPVVQKGGSTVAGTYGFMPPEQLLGRPCPASDTYSLAATIVSMLSGVNPADMRVADFRLVIDPHLENVPRPIVSVLHQMLEPNVDKRLCDYERLRYIFTQFSKDNYNIGDETLLAADADIDKKLAAVKAFNQPGNMDIWMQLPEKTPRDVPLSFSHAIMNLDYMQKLEPLQNTFSTSLMLTVAAAAITALLAFKAFSSNYNGFAWGVFAGIAAFVFLVLFCILLNNLISYLGVKKSVHERNVDFSLSQSRQDIIMICGYEGMYDVPILTLLKLGRKAIATIVDFTDLPIPEKRRSTQSARMSGGAASQIEIVSTSRVAFKLRYRFNPPDDSSPYDLIHEITIYNHQTEGLEPGSPIPILYYINPDDNTDVISMPYPYPFKEIENAQYEVASKENIFCQTKDVENAKQ